jgi:uncharacterized RDD family membrane protein YckC
MSTQLHILQDGKQTGPFSEHQVQSMLDSGFVRTTDLCWHEGLPAWVPISQVARFAAREPVPPAVGFPSQRASTIHGGQHPGFWLRLAAYFIDAIVTSVASACVGFVIGAGLSSAGITDGDALTAICFIAIHVSVWLYHALMESSSKQATLGKMACGFIVTNSQGQRISFGRASGRYFSMFVSAFVLCIGFIMCAWTSRKQCLHDMMAGCLMFKK